jgi:putative ABC transport system permease protein
MQMPMLVRLALRNLSRHAWRTAATVLGVAIGIAAVLATLSVGDNVEANVASTLAAAAGSAELLVAPGVQGRAVFAVADVIERIESDPDVERVYRVLNTRAEPVRDRQDIARSVIPGVDTGFQISGRDTMAGADLPVRTSSGALPTPGSHGVAVAENFAAQRGMSVGQTVAFAGQLGTLELRVTGLLDDSYGYASTNGGRVAVVALSDLQELLHLEGRASYLELHLRDDADTSAVQQRLSASLGGDYTVTYPAASGNIATGIVDTIQSGLSILAATLLALGGFMAYNTFMAGVVERRREYALLRTLCLTKHQVRRLALLEAAFVSLMGVASGLILGIVLAYAITRINAFSLGIEFRTLVLPLGSVLPASGVGVLVALLAGSLPARTASATPPLAALRQAEEYDGNLLRSLAGWLAVAAGVVLALIRWDGAWALAAAGIAMALLFLGFTLATPSLLRPALRLIGPLLHRAMGPPGKIGASFARRNAPRNGVAIGSVVVGMGLTIGVGAMVAGINQAIADWVDTTIVGDLFVTSPVSFPADFESAVPAAVPGIDEVSGVGIRIVRFEPGSRGRARSIAVVLVDPDRFAPGSGFGRFQYIPGQGNDEQGYRSLAAGGEVLLANTLRDRFELEQGDSVRLRTDEGFREFEIGGVIVDFTGGGEAVVGSIEDMELFGGGTPDLYVMTVHPGVDVEQARDRLREAFPDLYLDVTLNRDYREAIMTLTKRSFVTTNALLALAVFIAALGVANTLGMNLSNRRHELAVLRTFGLSRRGVGRVITAEGLVVLLVGTVLGVASGLLLAHVITAGAAAITGFAISPRYPWLIIVAALAASPVVGFLASYFPARRASRLPPILALGASE